jgi:hypothetical protein
MPAYEYQQGGKTIVRVLPVERRDDFPGRVVIPSTLHVCPRGEPTQGDQVLRGFYRCEEKNGTAAVRNTEKALGLTAGKVKDLWKHDR